MELRLKRVESGWRIGIAVGVISKPHHVLVIGNKGHVTHPLTYSKSSVFDL